MKQSDNSQLVKLSAMVLQASIYSLPHLFKKKNKNQKLKKHLQWYKLFFKENQLLGICS